LLPSKPHHARTHGQQWVSRLGFFTVVPTHSQEPAILPVTLVILQNDDGPLWACYMSRTYMHGLEREDLSDEKFRPCVLSRRGVRGSTGEQGTVITHCIH